MIDKTLSYASWNVTQYLKNTLTSLPSLRACVPDDAYDVEEEMKQLESDLQASLARADRIVKRLETLTEEKNKNESN